MKRKRDGLINSDFSEYDVIVEIVNTETEGGFEGTVPVSWDKDGESIDAEEKISKRVYLFS